MVKRKENREVNIQLEKDELKQEIRDTVTAICTSDASTCLFGYCVFNKVCAKKHLAAGGSFPPSRKRLKSMLKNASSKLNKKLQRVPRSTLLEACAKILGQDVFDHELVKEHQSTTDKIRAAKKMVDIVNILNERHKQMTGRYKSLPGGNARELYWKYQGENRQS
jgi:hypothetical protein